MVVVKPLVIGIFTTIAYTFRLGTPNDAIETQLELKAHALILSILYLITYFFAYMYIKRHFKSPEGSLTKGKTVFISYRRHGLCIIKRSVKTYQEQQPYKGSGDGPISKEMFHVVEKKIETGVTLSTTDGGGQDLNKYYLKHESLPSPGLLQTSEKLRRRQRRSPTSKKAAIRHILQTRKGRRFGSGRKTNKHLPGLLARMKLMKKIRNDKKKDLDEKRTEEQEIELKETFQNKSNIKELPSDIKQQQNNPGTTNEINLTVHVDMNERQPIAESKTSNTVGLDNPTEKSHKAFQTPRPNYPIRSSPRDILGIHLPLYDQNLMHNYYDQLNSIFLNQNTERDFAGLSKYPSRNMDNSMIYPVPVFSDPTLNTRLLDKYLKNNKETTKENNDFPADDRAVVSKFPIKKESALPILFPNLEEKSVTLNQKSTTERQQRPIMRNDMKLVDDFPEVQGANNEGITMNTTSNKQSDIHSNISDTLDNIYEQGDSNILENLSHREEVQEQSELRDLLSDIKSIVGSIAPLVKTNLDVTPNKIRNATNIDKAKIQTTLIEVQGTQTKELVNNDILNSTIFEKSNTERYPDGLNKNNIMKVENTKSENQYEDVKNKSMSNNKQMGLLSPKVNEPTKLHKTTTEETTVEVTTLLDQKTATRNRIKNLDSADFIRTLQNLNIISGREISMLHRMAPKLKKKTNTINIMFKQLMQRKYFRKNVGNLLGIASLENGDDDEDFYTNLIIALIELEEHLNHTPATIHVKESM